MANGLQTFQNLARRQQQDPTTIATAQQAASRDPVALQSRIDTRVANAPRDAFGRPQIDPQTRELVRQLDTTPRAQVSGQRSGQLFSELAGGQGEALSDFVRRNTIRDIEGAFTLSDPQAQALAGTAIGQTVAQTDPLAQGLFQRALQEFGGIQPGTFRQLGSQIGGLQGQAAGQSLAARGQGQAVREAQLDALGQLGRFASGEDSIVREQARLARSQLANQVASQAASSAGGFNPAGQRAALQALAGGQGQIAAQAVPAAAEERRQAIQALLGGQAGVRQQDLLTGAQDVQRGSGLAGILGQQAGLEQAANQAAGGLLDAAQSREAALRNAFLQQMNAAQGLQAQNVGAGEAIGGLLGSAGGIGAGLASIISDEQAKTEVEPSTDIGEFLDALEPQSWKYKPEFEDGGAQRHTGVMAQDLEKSRIGKGMVFKDDSGLRRVDYHPKKTGPVVMAALASLNKRLAQLED